MRMKPVVFATARFTTFSFVHLFVIFVVGTVLVNVHCSGF